MNTRSIGASAVDTTAALVRNADQQPEVGAKLLKKAMDADKNMVSTLLPISSPNGQQLNIAA